MTQPIQDTYFEDAAICYGCGRNNEHGLHIQTFWDGEKGNATFTPADYHAGFPGVVYGGLLASLVDCHCIGTAIAALYESEGREAGSKPEITCVTGTLFLKYLKPTPMDTELRLEATPTKIEGRKVTIACSVFANGEETVQAEVLAIRVPTRMGHDNKDKD